MKNASIPQSRRLRVNKWRLPTALRLGAVDFAIRTDYRVILGIFRVLNSEEYDETEKWAIAVKAFYIDADKIEDLEEAIKVMAQFFSGGADDRENDRKLPQLMDWEQDADILIPSVNKVAGVDVRGLDYLHWWTFLSYYMEIGDGTFSFVTGIRRKLAYGEKLEQHEKDYMRDHSDIVILKDAERRRQDEEDRAALAAIGL